MVSRTLLGALLVLISMSSVGIAQDNVLDDRFSFDDSFGGVGGDLDKLSLSGTFRILEGSNEGEVIIQADVAPNYHIYSVTQVGGPGPTKLELAENPNVELTGEPDSFNGSQFRASVDPSVKENDPTFNQRVESHYGTVEFKAPIRLNGVEDIEQFSFDVIFDGQVCTNGGCIPITGQVVNVSFGGTIAVPSKPGEYRPEVSHLTWEGYIEPQVVEPGGTVRVVLTAIPDAGFHTYWFAPYRTDKVQEASGTPTLIALTKRQNWPVDAPIESNTPIEHEGWNGESLYWHESPVSWSMDLTVPKSAEDGTYEIGGLIAFQTCKGEEFCDVPETAEFSASITVGSEQKLGKTPLTMVASTKTYNEVNDLAKAIPWGDNPNAGNERPVLVMLAFAFLAGLILNVMPCVLPVIGLKIMSFVDQAGANRWQIISLNLWFSAGLLFVFMILATMAAMFGLRWGEHFQNLTFTIVLTSIVFTFALSFLGVWEVPIPGFVGSSKTQKMANKEGAAGAFSKGILTTILATPCTGPFLIPAVSWAVTQPAWLIYVLFATIGLGMASPYLLIGAFPKMINVLPKPGAWMETFKQLMGFILLGTVVFLLSSVESKLVLPTLTSLVGIGFACWWIGKVQFGATLQTRLKAWGLGGGVAVLTGMFAFLFMAGGVELEWQPYDRVTLEDEVKKGNTVLIDFTADW